MIMLAADAQPPSLLLVVLHGVGSSANGMRPLGEMLHRAFPHAMVAIPDGPQPCDLAPGGRQWFSVRGITEESRPARVAPVLPILNGIVAGLQRQSGVPPSATILVGFSQGSILALEAAKAAHPPFSRIVVFAGRYAQLPSQPLPPVAIHWVHGDEDDVIASAHGRVAEATLRRLGAEATFDFIPDLGHGLNEDAVQRALEHLRSAPIPGGDPAKRRPPA